MMKNKIYTLIFALLNCVAAHAQYHFYFNDNIPVLVNGDTLALPWAGGFNCPQFSSIDLNGDGIKDLFVFDRDANKVITFINQGTANKVSYRYAPEYQRKFPQDMQEWALLADYNCDGKADLYTYDIKYGGGGVSLFRNDYNSTDGLQFTLIKSTIHTLWDTLHPNLYVSPINLPTMVDMDGDGDIDILSFANLGNIIQLHQNMSMDYFGTCDSINFKTQLTCWGNCGTNGSLNCFQLGLSCRLDPYDSTARMKHTGGCLLALELTGDNAKEMIVGDISSSTVDGLYNNGTNLAANIISQDCHYPQSDTPVYIHNFPACFYVDVNNDGIRDLICAPNSAGNSENTHGCWYYKNMANESIPDFKFQTTSFLQDQMIEVGQNSMPVFFDYDHDGLMDLIIGNYGYYDTTGNYRSSLSLFKNIGTATHPAYNLITKDFANIESLVLNQGVYPTFGDIDGDGKPDMISSDTSGYLMFFKDTAATGFPVAYDAPVRLYQNIHVDQYATPQLIDVNRDGLLDLVIGNRGGKLSYYKNTGTATVPHFDSITANFGGVNVRQYSTGYSQPFMFDSAGSYKLMVGSERGRIYYYNNIDGNLTGNFHLVDSIFNVNTMNEFDGTRVTVFGADIDGDGKMDIITGNQLGGVNLYVTTDYLGTHDRSNVQPYVSVFPNPSANELSIKVIGNNLTISSIQVMDILGQEVRKATNMATSSTMTLDSSHLTNGVYFGKVVLNTYQTVVVKIVIQH